MFKRNRYFWGTVFLLLLLFAVIFRYWNHSYRNIVASDGKGYYAYLPAVVLYHDLDYNYFFNGELQIEKDYTSSFLFIIEGHDVVKYPAGVSFLLLPFFLVAIVLSFLAGTPIDGYSFWFQICASIGAITYTTLGLYWTSKILSLYNISRSSLMLCLFALLLGTNLTIYTIWDPTMSHAYSFSMIALFLFKTGNIVRNFKKQDLLWAAFALGSIILIRPVNAIIVFAIPAILPHFSILREQFRNIWKYPLNLLLAVLIFGCIVFIQPLLWYLQNNMWFVYTYLGETFNFNKPEIFKILFSYRKGWFVYTPLMVLIIPGLFVMLRKNFILNSISILLFSGLVIYILSSWWCWYYGGSFGQRSFIDFYPLMIIPIGFLVDAFHQKPMKIIIHLLFVVIILVNLIQSYQYKNNILHYDSMTREGYWKIFLKISDKYKWSLFGNPNDKADDDISDKLITRYFQDFEYEKPNWSYRKSDDISDDALSGNKVIGFHNQVAPVQFKVEADSILSSNDGSKNIRFTGWFTGTTEKLLCNFLYEVGNDTLISKQIKGGEFQIIATKNDWIKKQIDLPIPGKIEKGTKIEFILNEVDKKVLYLDDAQVSIYRN